MTLLYILDVSVLFDALIATPLVIPKIDDFLSFCFADVEKAAQAEYKLDRRNIYHYPVRQFSDSKYRYAFGSHESKKVMNEMEQTDHPHISFTQVD